MAFPIEDQLATIGLTAQSPSELLAGILPAPIETVRWTDQNHSYNASAMAASSASAQTRRALRPLSTLPISTLPMQGAEGKLLDYAAPTGD